jgi:hypothetical protein
MAMGNRTARNTGIFGTGVEAIGDEEKMSEKPFKDNFVARLIRERDEARSFAAHYVKSLTDEAEARGYRRGVEDAAGVARTWDTTGQGHLPNANGYDAQAVRIAVNIRALLEQTSDTNSPHPKSGAGASAEAK